MGFSSRRLSKSDHGMIFLLHPKSLRKTHSLFSVPTQLKVLLVRVTKQLKIFFSGFRRNVLRQLEVPTSMTLRCFLLPWSNAVLTAVVNKLISMSFLRSVSWVCVNYREAHPGMQSLVKLSSRISKRDLLFLSITAVAVFSFHAAAIMLSLLLSSLVMIKSEREDCCFHYVPSLHGDTDGYRFWYCF